MHQRPQAARRALVAPSPRRQCRSRLRDGFQHPSVACPDCAAARLCVFVIASRPMGLSDCSARRSSWHLGTSSCRSPSRFGRAPLPACSPGCVTSRPIKACDKSSLTGSSPSEHDRDRRVATFAAIATRSPGRGNHCHLATDQIGRQCWQSIVVALGRPVLDRDVPTLEKASFLKPWRNASTRCCSASQSMSCRGTRSPASLGCCARAASGHAAAAPPSVNMNSRRRMWIAMRPSRRGSCACNRGDDITL